jgi:hypothetical protein
VSRHRRDEVSDPRRRLAGRSTIAPGQASVDRHFRMGAKQYDAAYAQARRDRLTVPEWIRRVVDQVTERDR